MILSAPALLADLSSLAFANEDWAWVAAAFGGGALVVLVLAYRRSPLRGGAKAAAMALKALGLVLLALALMEPVHLDEKPKPHSNDVAVVADHSAGLAVPLSEGAEPPSAALRAALAQDEAGEAPAWLGAVAETFRVQPFLLDRGLRQVADFSGLDFARPGTTLGAALENLEMRFRGRPLAAAVLLTDGNATDGAALEAWIARQESLPAEERLPVFPVLVGETDPAARDLSLVRVDAATTQFEDAQVTLTVEAAALGEFPDPVEVYALDEKGEELGKKDLAFPSGEGRRTATVRLRLGGVPPGLSFLAVGIRQHATSPLPQLTELNDRLLVAVDRGSGPYRILYLGGRPNWEYKFLRRALAEDAELDLVGLIRIARREPKFEWRGRTGETSNPLFRGFGGADEETQRYDEPVLVRLNTATPEELRDGFPKAAEELFSAYRAIVIDDLEADFLSQEQMNLLDRFVALRGGTLVMLGGRESFQGGGWDNTPVGRLLPVYLDAPDRGEAALDATWNLTREGSLEDWMRLRASNEEEEIRLAHMPPFFALNRLPAIKPGARLLATATDPLGRLHPALVTQRYGEGKSAALAVADFWRWGMKDEEQRLEFEKAWRQFLRWAVTDVPGRVEVEKEELSEGAIPLTRVSVRVRDLAFEPQDDATVRLVVKDLGGAVREIAAEPSLEEPGLFVAEHLSEDSEGYRIEAVAVDGSGREVGRGEVGRALNPEAAEYARLGPDREGLARLAAATGGELLGLGELGRLPQLLRRLDLPVVETTQRPLWHTPWLFLLALLCFLGEWGLRRRKGTV